MAHPYHHALSSVKKWGGTVDDYTRIHGWFDESKLIIADFRHRALRHHAEGVFMAVIWTGKPALMFASTEVVVPVVHRRGPAVRVAVSTRKRSGRWGGACGPTGASTGPCAISLLQPRFAYGNHQRPRATGSASVWISAAGGERTLADPTFNGEIAPIPAVREYAIEPPKSIWTSPSP